MGLLLLDSPDPAPAPARSAESYASMLTALLPPGRLWRLLGAALGSLLDRLLLGSADELVRVDQRVADLLNEADPRTAFELLPEYERELAVAGAIDLAERRGRIVARLVARQGFRPADFRAALAPLLAQDPSAVVVLERTPAFAASIGDAREIFRAFIYRDPTLPGTAFIASAQTQATAMKPSHTVVTVIESIALACDDAHSLCDRDLLGA